MKKLIALLLIVSFELCADYVKKTIAVCSDRETAAQLSEYAKKANLDKGGLEVELWLMQHDCQVIDKKTKIEVLEYSGKEQPILKLLLKDSGDVVFTMNKGIQIEQPGDKDIIYKF